MSRTYNVVDADGHILEPADLWTKGLPQKFRDLGPRVVVDDTGRDRIAVGERVLVTSNFGSQLTGTVGVAAAQIKKMSYADGKQGGFDPHARIKDLDLDGIDAVVLYPSMGLKMGAISDPEMAAAVCRVYNEWIADWCKAYPDRLYGVAMLPLQSVEHAVSEMRYARDKLGLPRAFLRPNPYNDVLLNDPAYDPIWEEAQELDVSISFHESAEGFGGTKTVGFNRVDGYAARHIVSHTMEMMLASLNIIWGGVCERFPKVRFGFLEAGGGWMAPWLDRMDRHFDRTGIFDVPYLKMRPSDYFRRQCWIAFEPPEGTIASSAQYLGADKILWATDYPHVDGFFPGAPQTIAKNLPDSIRRQVMAQGAIDFYRL